jgi:hypothetical protein
MAPGHTNLLQVKSAFAELIADAVDNIAESESNS